MKISNELCLKFEEIDWSLNPEFGLLDTIFEKHPKLYKIVSPYILPSKNASFLGRGDVPNVEQIVRAAIYKELKNYDYRDLEYAQFDSRICAAFIKFDNRKPFSFKMF